MTAPLELLKIEICTVPVNHECGGERSFILCKAPCPSCGKKELCPDHHKEFSVRLSKALSNNHQYDCDCLSCRPFTY